MTEDLVAKKCTPCRGGSPPLTAGEARRYQEEVPGWALLDDTTRISRTYKFRTFADAFEFVRRVSAAAEEEGHHPDIAFGWGYVTVSLQTKKIKGLHENDFIMAAKFDRLASAPA